MNVIGHHAQLKNVDAVPLGGTSNACFASIYQLKRVEYFVAVFRAPLKMVHVLKHRMARARQIFVHFQNLRRRNSKPRASGAAPLEE